MATPQITLRVDKDTLDRWKQAAAKEGTSVSAKVRELMNSWANSEEWPDLQHK